MLEVVSSQSGVVFIAAYIFSEVVLANLEGVVHGEGISVVDVREAPRWGLSVGAFGVGGGSEYGQ